MSRFDPSRGQHVRERTFPLDPRRRPEAGLARQSRHRGTAGQPAYRHFRTRTGSPRSRHDIPQGSVISLDMDALKQDAAHLKPAAIFTPNAVEFAQEVQATRVHLFSPRWSMSRGVLTYTRLAQAGEWTRKKLDLPDNQTVDVLPSDGADDRFFLEVQGFLTPSSLLLGDPPPFAQNVKSLKPQFDASHDVVEQLEAKSKDGTMVPYFVVHREDLNTMARTQP